MRVVRSGGWKGRLSEELELVIIRFTNMLSQRKQHKSNVLFIPEV